MATNRHVHALPAGQRLREFEIEGVLGNGAFGITYAARDTALDRKVAIKEYLFGDFAIRGEDRSVVPKSIGDKETDDEIAEKFRWGLERFLGEARILAKIDHPQVVRVWHFFEDNGTAYFVMPFEAGVDFRKYLCALDRPLTEVEVRAIAEPLLDGLEAVHAAGTLHRDLKPANILIRENGSPLLLDFGAARQAVGGKSTMTTVLTHGYAPFEQYSNRGQGPWTDIYALGAVFYHSLVSGLWPPLPRATERSEAVYVNREPDPLAPAGRAFSGWCSAELAAALDWALQIRAKDRPQSVAEWREAWQTKPSTALPPNPVMSSITTTKTVAVVETGQSQPPAAEVWEVTTSESRPTLPQGAPSAIAQAGESAIPRERPPRVSFRGHRKGSRFALVGTAILMAMLTVGVVIVFLMDSRPDDALNAAASQTGSGTDDPAPTEVARQRDAQRAEAARQADEQAWQVARGRDTVDAMQVYLAAHPGGAHIAEANQRIAQLEQAEATRQAEQRDWDDTSREGTRSALQSFLTRYPQGVHAAEASERIGYLDRVAAEDQAWAAALQARTTESLQSYVARYPNGAHLAEARQRIAALEQVAAERQAWEVARAGSQEDLQSYLTTYPDGAHVDEARQRIAALELAAADEQAWATAIRARTLSALQYYIAQYPQGAHVAEANRLIAASPPTAVPRPTQSQSLSSSSALRSNPAPPPASATPPPSLPATGAERDRWVNHWSQSR